MPHASRSLSVLPWASSRMSMHVGSRRGSWKHSEITQSKISTLDERYYVVSPRLPNGRSRDCGISSNVNVCEKAKHHTELFWYKLYKFIFVTALARRTVQQIQQI